MEVGIRGGKIEDGEAGKVAGVQVEVLGVPEEEVHGVPVLVPALGLHLQEPHQGLVELQDDKFYFDCFLSLFLNENKMWLLFLILLWA